MKLMTGRVEIDDLDACLGEIAAIGDETGSTIQLFDARYVASERHLRRAVELASRAIERGTAVARDPAVEVLLYAAGRRQIDQALEMGVAEGSIDAVGVVTGGDEDVAARLIQSGSTVSLETDVGVTLGEASVLRSFFDVGDAELKVVDGDLGAIVLERVALLDVEK